MLKVIENDRNLSVERRCVSGIRGDYYLSVLFVLVCFAIIAIFANKFRDGVWSTLDWFFVSSDQDFIVCLHELDGEVRSGISFRKEKDAEELCERLNRLLTHYQQNKSVCSAAGSSRSGESHLNTR